jgi:hypothetical protein
MTPREAELFDLIQSIANIAHDGHFTVMKFTTNWRVGFGTTDSRDDIDRMAVGSTFEEAALSLLREIKASRKKPAPE